MPTSEVTRHFRYDAHHNLAYVAVWTCANFDVAGTEPRIAKAISQLKDNPSSDNKPREPIRYIFQ